MILCVVWVVLMMFWLFLGGYVSHENNTFNSARFGSGTLIPWLCVAILGWIAFGGLRSGRPLVNVLLTLIGLC